MSNKFIAQKNIIEYAMAQLKGAIKNSGTDVPVKSLEKLGNIYFEISKLEKQRENQEISEEEFQKQILQLSDTLK